MKIDVIGLSGKASSGKNYMSTHVFEKHGFSPWALAWPLKVAVLGSTSASFEDVFVTKPPEVRAALQRIGTDEGRAKNPNVWIDQTRAWLRILHDNLGLTKFVITDVRFPNEAALVRDLGGKLVRLTHGFGLPYALAGTAAAEHSSETALDDWKDWDLQVINGLSSMTAAWGNDTQSFHVGDGQTLTAAGAMKIFCEKAGVL